MCIRDRLRQLEGIRQAPDKRAVGILVDERKQRPMSVPALDELADVKRLIGQPGRLRHVVRAEQRVRPQYPDPARLTCLPTRGGQLGSQTVEQQQRVSVDNDNLRHLEMAESRTRLACLLYTSP